MKNKNIISGTGLALAAIIAITVIIIANGLFTSLRLDLTENKLFTLSEGSVNITTSLDEPMRLEFYFSRKVLADFPQMMNYGSRVRDLLEEYAAKSNGKLDLIIIEPEPFSEEEDQAVASGLQGIAVNAAGDRAYFGLVGTNSTDDEAIIPFFQSSRETALEYDITKLIYNLANPKKRVIGVVTQLPMFGDATTGSRQWTIIKVMEEFFEVRDLGTDVGDIDEEIDVLMLVHPKDLSEKTLFSIDQYLLAGGKGMIFIDPLAEADTSRPDPSNPYVLPDMSSDLKLILNTWGIELLPGKVAADINLAMRVQTSSQRGPVEADYLPWLRITEEYLNREDFISSELKLLHAGTAGILKISDDSSLEFSPLIKTSRQSMAMEKDLVLFQQDPNVMLSAFESEDKEQVIAVRLSGKVTSTFPDGLVEEKVEETASGASEEDTQTTQLTEGDINVILVADTDILADIFWTRVQSFFGLEIPQTIANNGDFVINGLENLSGNTDMISLRSRGEFSRPFTVVEQIRRDAEDQFRAREQELQAKLDETERKIVELQQERGEGDLLLSPEQEKEIESFRLEQVKTRKELRAVQHELQKNIESLGTRLKFINIGLIPLLIAILAIIAGYQRSRRRA